MTFKKKQKQKINIAQSFLLHFYCFQINMGFNLFDFIAIGFYSDLGSKVLDGRL